MEDGNRAKNKKPNDMALYNTSGKKIEKSAIMVYNENDVNVSINNAWGHFQIPFKSVKTKIGDKFSLDDKGNVVYTGNKSVKMTLHISRKNTTNGNLYVMTIFGGGTYECATSSNPYATAVEIFTNKKTFNGWVTDSIKETVTFSKGEETYMLLEEI